MITIVDHLQITLFAYYHTQPCFSLRQHGTFCLCFVLRSASAKRNTKEDEVPLFYVIHCVSAAISSGCSIGCTWMTSTVGVGASVSGMVVIIKSADAMRSALRS